MKTNMLVFILYPNELMIYRSISYCDIIGYLLISWRWSSDADGGHTSIILDYWCSLLMRPLADADPQNV